MNNLMRLVLEELIRERNGGRGRILGRNLAAKLDIEERTVRAVISDLRAEGFPVLGYTGGVEGGAGYWFSTDKDEIRDWLEINRRRILIQIRAYNGVKRNAKKFISPKQIEIPI